MNECPPQRLFDFLVVQGTRGCRIRRRGTRGGAAPFEQLSAIRAARFLPARTLESSRSAARVARNSQEPSRSRCLQPASERALGDVAGESSKRCRISRRTE